LLKSVEITVKGEMPDLYVVNSGITAADKILLDGLQKANDNDKIKYDYLDPKEVLAHLRLKAE
jgi:membrane fusion protein (multidrug efflux system)